MIPPSTAPRSSSPSASQTVLPSRDDPLVAAASELVGGPVGRHARLGGSWWTPLRVLLALTLLTLAVGFAQKAPCRTHAWTGEYQYVHMCYTDVYALYFAEHLDRGERPYFDHPVEYPVLIGGLMWVAARAVEDAPQGQRAARFFDITTLLLTVCALVVVVTTVQLAGRRPWDAAIVAIAPTLALHATTNWDLAAVALAGLGMLAWARRRPGWAGVFLGLGAATKLYPALLLVPLFLLCLRAGNLTAWARATGAAVLAWLLVDLPIWVLRPTAFARFFTLNRDRGADWDSLWFALAAWRGAPLDPGLPPGAAPERLNLAVAASFVALLALLAVLTFVAPRRPRVAQLALLTVIAFLLTNKVFSPQYTLWLLPLAALARPRWSLLLIWQASEVLLLVARFYLFVGNAQPTRGLAVPDFLAAVLLRDAALVVLAALVVWEVLRPERDVVRDGGVDDPAGGVLDGAADRVARPLPAARGAEVAPDNV